MENQFKNDYILEEINSKLNITHDILIFIYTAPKVGSTSLVSSFRIFGGNHYGIIHIHDEVMLKKLIGIDTADVSINDLIEYNARLGKIVYVIDIYRNPIERKISAFFEKIGSYHFNNRDEIVNRYNVQRIIKRFNNIFPYLANGDHYMDKYGINLELPDIFPHEQKYLIIEKNRIKYLKLRLKDVDEWEHILSRIFKHKICVVKDYQSENKIIGDLFKNFLEKYKIPENFLNEIIVPCNYLNYYYSQSEKNEYLNKWNIKKCINFIPYTLEQYIVYEDITLENCYIDNVQLHHYIDDGCSCQACIIKRNTMKQNILNKKYNGERIFHVEAKKELIGKRLIQVKQMNNAIQNSNLNKNSNDIKSRMKYSLK
jgi:hypothetical protein